MSEINSTIAGTTAQSPVKRGRRGVTNETKAVAQLKFHEKDAAQNGLFIGHLHSVSVDWSTNTDSSAFNGIPTPRLTFHFASNHANESEMRHVYQTLFPVESSVDTMEGGAQEWRVNNVLNWIKHLLDVFYLKGRNLTNEEMDALCLPFNDKDEEGNYAPIDAQEVVDGYRSLFENAAAMFNGSWNLKDGEVAKPVFKNADGKYIPCWMKLLRCKKVKNNWKNVASGNAAGDLAFDFIGAGAVELQKGTNAPSILRIDLSKESITPKEVNKEPAPGIGAPSTLGNVIAGTGMGMAPNTAFADAGTDGMPF